MTVSTSDLSLALTRIQIKLLVDYKLLRSYSNGMGDGKLLRLDMSDNQGLPACTSLLDCFRLRLLQVESPLWHLGRQLPVWMRPS